jgi:hypothetical protein
MALGCITAIYRGSTARKRQQLEKRAPKRDADCGMDAKRGSRTVESAVQIVEFWVHHAEKVKTYVNVPFRMPAAITDDRYCPMCVAAMGVRHKSDALMGKFLVEVDHHTRVLREGEWEKDPMRRRAHKCPVEHNGSGDYTYMAALYHEYEAYVAVLLERAKSMAGPAQPQPSLEGDGGWTIVQKGGRRKKWVSKYAQEKDFAVIATDEERVAELEEQLAQEEDMLLEDQDIDLRNPTGTSWGDYEMNLERMEHIAQLRSAIDEVHGRIRGRREGPRH